MQVPPLIRIGGNLTKSQYLYTLQTPDPTDLHQQGRKLVARYRVCKVR
jgi:hypothetical protein